VYILTVKNLSKRYSIGTRKPRALWALKDVSFAVERGTILGIVGPNGAGKTTLLKVLSRITPPTEGRIFGHGRVVPLLAIGAGFQQELSGRENVFLNAATYGIPASEVERRFDDIVEFAGLAEFIDVPVKRYSSGMYLRLAFSVAINMQPDILLADEVLAVGDAEFQEQCLERVQQAGRAGMCVLFVSHDMAAITRLCDRVLWLNAGEVVKIGKPQEIVAEYQSSAWSLNRRRLNDGRGSSHRNPFGEILFVTLVASDGREVGAVRTTDEVAVKIGVRFEQGGFDARCTLHVRTNGLVAFRARPTEDYRIDQPGLYSITARIPANILAPVVYSLSVDVTAFTAGEPHPMSALNALTFHAFDPKSEQRDHLGSLVAPVLQWEIRRETHSETQEPASRAGASR
jgi:lipopolysaccharide transport system ATP-binding protein